MKKVFNICAIVFLVGLLPLVTHADGPINVDVPNGCTVTDTAGVQHVFPKDDSPSDYLGVCALAEALAKGYVSDVDFVDFGFGLFVDNLNNIAKPENTYWQLRLNDVGSNVGVTDMSLSVGDTMLFVLTAFDPITFAETPVVPEQAIRLYIIVLRETPPPSGGGGSSGGIPNSQLNVASALAYLASEQSEDGSFGSSLLSDWTAIAFAAADPGDAKVKLTEYMRTATTTFFNVTDYERHAMALLALGIDPYSGTSVDYITPIVNAFDGKQIGDASLDNDDIFALFPLLHAGYNTNDTLIQKTVAFILSRQGQNGSWDGSADMTAAAIQSLVQVRMLPDVSLALIRAEGYLRGERPSANSFSTSWVRQAISALSWTPSGWTPNSFTEEDYLAELQQSDGGVEPESSGTQTRVWATAYAIPSALGKSWPLLLQSFPKSAATTTSSILQEITQDMETATTTATTSPPTISRNASTKAETRVIKIPPPPQVAAVANAPAAGFFTHFWSVIASFFINLLY